MSYSQEKNPLSRKTSPLNANNPFKRISPLYMKEKDVKHKEMSEKDLAIHKAKKHKGKGGDPDMERQRREEEMSRSSNEPIGPERKSSDPNTKLSAYTNVDPEDIPGYDDGAGGFDYEAKAKANSAPGSQYTDEAAEAAFKKMKYTTDAAIRSGAGVDLGTIKKSPLNDLGVKSKSKTDKDKIVANIKPRTGYNTMHMDDKRAKEISELSINRSLAGKAASKKMKRTEVGRNLKPAGKVGVETAKEGLAETMQTMTEKAKNIKMDSKPVRTGIVESFETRARKAVKAPSKDSANKMSISRKNCKYKK